MKCCFSKTINCLFFLFFLFTVFSCRSTKTVKTSVKNKNSTHTVTPKNIKDKYALRLGVDRSYIINIKLYEFVDEWLGVPYKAVGKTKKGIDCSGFASILYEEIYNKMIQGSSESILKSCKVIPVQKCVEGDLVFFNITGKGASHVGVYLQNNKFVHASVKSGVIINNLDEPYYKKYFYKAGRVGN